MDICHLAIKAYTGFYSFVKGKEIHSKIPKDNDNIDIIDTLIAFHGHFGDMEYALNIFNSMNGNKKDIVTINAMMTVCINNQYYKEALVLI